MKNKGRIAEHDQFSMLLAMLGELFSIPRDLSWIEALVVFGGLDAEWRPRDAIQYWEEGVGRYLLISGYFREEKTWIDLGSREILEKMGLTRWDGVHSTSQEHITPDQAKWFLNMCQELNIKSAALFAPSYFMLRAYCTVVKQMMDREDMDWIPIIPMPIRVSPDSIIPETRVGAWEMYPAEMKKVLEYQEKGDVATFFEFQKYISWLYEKHINNKEG